MIDTCPMCFEKLMPMMIHPDLFICDLCGAFAENLSSDDIEELQNIIDMHNASKLNKENKNMARDFARLEFLQPGFGNSIGDIVKVVNETDGEVYYYDGFNRYCYMNKSEEGINYRYIRKGTRLKRQVK